MSLSKNPFVEFLKATLAGGVLFPLPVVLVLIVLHRAMSYALGAAKPISHLLPIESVIGAYGENALAIFMLILVSLLAGLVARTREGRQIMRWSENSLLGGLPQYQLVKTMAEGRSHASSEHIETGSTGSRQVKFRMSTLGHLQTFRCGPAMFALPPRADILGAGVPIADIEVLCIAEPMIGQRSYQASRSS